MPYQTKDYPTKLFYFFSFFLILSLSSLKTYAAEQWRELRPGIEYQDLEMGFSPWSRVHLFRIDLNKNRLELIKAQNLGLNNAQVELFTKKSHALIGMNGGFFDQDFKPLGLRMNHNNIENPLKRISWWGIFYIKNNQAHIFSLKQFKADEDIEMAIQSGPRLLINGKIPRLKAGKDDRSALGIRADGKVILLVSSNAPMSTKELARLMKTPPLSCIDAINLDGGSSSQLYAQIDSFTVNVHGLSNVSDAIVVKPIG